MRKFLLLLLLLIPSLAFAQAKDIRISDSDGDILNINSDGTIPISGASGGGGGANGWTDIGVKVHLTTSTDNVGIGTSDPISKLSVVGGAYFTGNVGIGATNLDFPLQVTDTSVTLNANSGHQSAFFNYAPSSAIVDTASKNYGPLTINVGPQSGVSGSGGGQPNLIGSMIGLDPNAGDTADATYIGQMIMLQDTDGLAGTVGTMYNGSLDYSIASMSDFRIVTVGGSGPNPELFMSATDGNVGIGTSTPAGRLDLGDSNIVFVGCSDSIDTAITNATAGDTLQLGSCSYSISSALTVNKSLRILGMGSGITTITSSAANGNMINITSDNVALGGMKLVTSAMVSPGTIVYVDGQSGTVFNNVNMQDLIVNAVNTDGSGQIVGISYRDAGGDLENVFVHIEPYTGTPSGQSKGIEHIHNSGGSTGEADTVMYLRNVRSEIYEMDTTSDGQQRAFFSWMNGTYDPTVGSVINYIQDSVFLVKPAGTLNDTEAFQNQGDGGAYSAGVNGQVISYVYGGYIDGAYNTFTSGASLAYENYRIDDRAVTYFYGTKFGENAKFTSANSGEVYKIGGTIYAQGIVGDKPPKGSSYLPGNTLISLSGQDGGDNNSSGAIVAPAGASVSITTGVGGGASAATTSGTGGQGGSMTFTTAAGGQQNTATSSINNGGAGGDITFTLGVGGVANSGTTNTGGRGGLYSLTAGNGSIGTQTGGAGGSITKTSGTGAFGITGGAGGALTLKSGVGATGTTTSGAGGAVVLQAQNGGASIGGTGGAGGVLTIQSGTGGSVSGSATPGASGAINITAGQGGGYTGGAGATGGNINLSAGNGGNSTSGNSNGGHIILMPGLQSGGGGQNGRVGIATSTPLVTLDVVGAEKISGTFTSTATSDLGWSIKAGADTACNTTCTRACVMGFASAVTGSDPVACTDATADNCLCAGIN